MSPAAQPGILRQLAACLGQWNWPRQAAYRGRVILCTGAHTAWLLAESAPDRPEVQVGDRMVAAAAVMCVHQLPGDQNSKFSSAPVIIQAVGDYPGKFLKKLFARGARMLTCVQYCTAECIPPGEKGLIKCTHELSFSHKVLHKPSNTHISVPPSQTTRNTWPNDVPQGLKDEMAAVIAKLFGSWVQNFEPYTYRMCW